MRLTDERIEDHVSDLRRAFEERWSFG